jgi:hypothetical protein
MLRKTLKVLHEIAAVGVLGSLAACIVLVAAVPAGSEVEYAALRRGIAAIEQWLLLPSLLLVLISGLLAIAANDGYINAGWPWLKALLGLSMFEGTLLAVSAPGRDASALSALAAAGPSDPAQLAQVLRTEWGGLWTILAVSLANIVIAVWRPRFIRSRSGP